MTAVLTGWALALMLAGFLVVGALAIATPLGVRPSRGEVAELVVVCTLAIVALAEVMAALS